MSTTLFFLIPIGMLAVAWSFCFVGCVFQTGGIGSPYSNIVLADNPVAYWPLGDLEGPTAVDLTGRGHEGTYTVPKAYMPGTTPFATPTLNLHQPSIVPGDVSASGVVDKNLFPGSTDFEGGYVSIPWSTQSPPTLSAFTLEAWIKPHSAGAGLLRVVFSAFINNTGFVVFIDGNNLLRVTIGIGTSNMMPPSTVSVDPTATTYIAVTGDSNTGMINVWMNPQSQSDQSNPPPPMPNQTINANYVPADPTQLFAIFIGAGANDQPVRTADGGSGAPLLPFVGQIQDVALYGAALGGSTLQNHFTNGKSS